MNASREKRSLRIVTYPPLRRNPWFWLGCILASGLPLAAAFRKTCRGRDRKQSGCGQSEKLVEQERLRIARDLHDDLGARLTHISIVSGRAEHELLSGLEARQQFQKISAMARDTISSLYEAVWTIDPESDRLDSLIDYLSRMVDGLCEPMAIRFRIRVPETLDDYPVAREIRHNLSHAVKEIAHNAIKHSGAAEISMQFSVTAALLTIALTDDGCGFIVENTKFGNGLKNMRHRMEAIGGQAQIDSVENIGHTVRLEVDIG